MRELLGGFAFVANRFLKLSGYPFIKDWVFRFNGLSTEDKAFEADLRGKNVKTVMTVDEVRETLDLPPLPDGQGEIILDSVFLQNKAQAAMAAEGGESGDGMGEMGDMEGGEDQEQPAESGGNDEEIDDMAEEAMQSLEKAVRIL